jgi:hypothetical protein
LRELGYPRSTWPTPPLKSLWFSLGCSRPNEVPFARARSGPPARGR